MVRFNINSIITFASLVSVWSQVGATTTTKGTEEVEAGASNHNLNRNLRGAKTATTTDSGAAETDGSIEKTTRNLIDEIVTLPPLTPIVYDDKLVYDEVTMSPMPSVSPTTSPTTSPSASPTNSPTQWTCPLTPPSHHDNGAGPRITYFIKYSNAAATDRYMYMKNREDDSNHDQLRKYRVTWKELDYNPTKNEDKKAWRFKLHDISSGTYDNGTVGQASLYNVKREKFVDTKHVLGTNSVSCGKMRVVRGSQSDGGAKTFMFHPVGNQTPGNDNISDCKYKLSTLGDGKRRWIQKGREECWLDGFTMTPLINDVDNAEFQFVPCYEIDTELCSNSERDYYGW